MDTRFALPTNTVLDGAYRIVRVVGLGGFGVTYEAEDIKLATTVAIKEYYPVDYGDRDRTMSVRPKSERHKKPFEWGRASFLKEARTLARFDHPSIVRVSRVFEAHSTAYMVMGFERGQSFEAWLNGLGRPPTQEELDAIALPLLDALELLHAANFLHRDIAPDNIIVRADGSPVLLDFGAARRAVAEMSRALTGIVKAGYSPHEQYSSNNRLQGPWSDFYALGGTFYRAITGGPPEEAALRVDDDRMAPAALAARGSYRRGFLAGIDACLRVKHTDRPQSVAQLRPMLLGEETPARSVFSFRTSTSSRSTPLHSASRSAGAGGIGGQWPLAAAAILMVLGSAYGGIEFIRWQQQRTGIAAQPESKGAGAQTAKAEAEKRRKEAAEASQRQAALDMERQRQEAAARAAAEAAQRAEAERRLREERAAEDAARRAQAEAEEKRRTEAAAEERRRAEAAAEARRKAEAAAEEQRRAAAAAEERRKEEERRRDPAQVQGRILKLATRLDKHPYDPKKGWLSVAMEALELSVARGLGLVRADGAIILNAPAGSAAARGGIRIGDVVLSLNGQPVGSPEDLRRRVSTMAPGSEAGLEVWRVDGEFLEALRLLADAGNAEAMYRVGRMYARGQGAPRNDAETMRWYRKAADAGSVRAQVALASMLLEGRGVAQNREEGLQLLRGAAAKKDSEAVYLLGRELLEGRDKDPPEAVRLFTQAAEAGHVGAMVAIGQMYAAGTGVPADPSRAARWFTQAVDLYRKDAELGSSIAMNNLAWMLQSGVARKDPTEAASLMMKSLEQRNEFSLRQMTRPGENGFDGWSLEFRVALQKALRDAGLYAGKANGVFGPATIKAIEAQFNRNR